MWYGGLPTEINGTPTVCGRCKHFAKPKDHYVPGVPPKHRGHCTGPCAKHQVDSNDSCSKWEGRNGERWEGSDGV